MERKSWTLYRNLLVAGLVVAIAGAGAVVLHARLGRGASLESQKQRRSYALGMDLGTGARRQAIDVDVALIERGLRDALDGKETLLSEEEARAALTELQTELRGKRAAQERELGDRNSKEGEAFRVENGRKEGVVTLASGLQYKVLKQGQGKTPTDSDVVECSYRGTRVDGSEFDSSTRRGRPVTVPVQAAIPGWKEALKLMPVGSTWQIVMPPELAYGARAPRNLPQIGPNATLVFEVELLRIQDAPARPVGGEKSASARRGPRLQAR